MDASSVLWVLFDRAETASARWQVIVGLTASAALVLMAAVVARQARSPIARLGRPLYADTPDHATLEHPVGLVGRPDFIVQRRSMAVPVELKTGRRPRRPAAHHVWQLAAYGLLVEARTGSFPTYGYLVYRRCESYRVDRVVLGPRVRAMVVRLIEAIRSGVQPTRPLPVADGTRRVRLRARQVRGQSRAPPRSAAPESAGRP